jgi:hypothetical protein
MFEWHRLPLDQRKSILSEANNITGYPAAVIEKYWWVTLALRAVFSTPWADHSSAS